MTEIPIYKRDDSKDHLAILRSLNEIPFPLGKNLLVDFLTGDLKNKSIIKNKLEDFYNFAGLDFLNKSEVFSLLERLITNGLIELSSAAHNPYIKVLTITEKGKDELKNPIFINSNNYNRYNGVGIEITREEKELIQEFSSFLKGFNSEQKKSIISENKNILCIAGAGSGKTSVLTKRIEFLNKNRDVSASDILAITFTRKARREMQNRLEILGVKNVNIETFNSFCEKILKRNPEIIYGRKVRVAGYQDKLMALIMAINNLGMSFEEVIDIYFTDKQKENKNQNQLQTIFMNDCFSILDYFKSKKKELKEFEKKAYKSEPKIKIIFEIARFLEEYMFTQGLRTYNDQIIDCLDFFKNHPEKIPKFEHILIDEYQDVNSQQVELVDILKPNNLFCVGDPRQSIFGWRGSDIGYILDFKEKYHSAEIINLKKNYRSNNHIVEFMNKAIEKMKMPELESEINGEKNIEIISFEEETEEVNFIIEKIKNSITPYEEIFILARTNRQLTELSKKLLENKISHIVKTEGSYDTESKKDYITLSTIHSIKGLEAEMVFVIGCNNLNFPCKTGDSPVFDIINMNDYDKEDEERRLFYVAVSRAKNYLYLTYSGKNHTYFINDEMKKIAENLN